MNNRCPHCGSRYATWSRQAVIAAAQEWHRRYGVAPTAQNWVRSASWHPAASGVFRQFGSWNEMVAAAGFEPRKKGGQRMYDREFVKTALFEWMFAHGRLPTGREWRRPEPGRPTQQQVIKLFGSWNAGLVWCGYVPVKSYRDRVGYSSQIGAATRRMAA